MTTATATNGRREMATADSGSGKDMRFIPFGSDSAIKLNVAIVKSLCSAKTKSGAVATESDAIKFMMLCKARGLNPFEGDAFLVGYDSKDGPQFSMITAHQAFLKRAECHPAYDGMESGVVVLDQHGVAVDREGDFLYEGEIVAGGWARVHLKNRKIPMYKRLSYGARSKSSRFWDDDPAGMIVKCAEADALRSAFPTVLGGMYLREEVVEEFPTAQAVTVEKPSPLTPGRHSLRKPVAPVNPVQEPVDDPQDAISDDNQAAPHEDDGADMLAEEIANAIEETTTIAGHQTVGADLKRAEEHLGQERYAKLLAKFQEKGKTLKK